MNGRGRGEKGAAQQSDMLMLMGYSIALYLNLTMRASNINGMQRSAEQCAVFVGMGFYLFISNGFQSSNAHKSEIVFLLGVVSDEVREP